MVSGMAHRVDECDLTTLGVSDWCNVLAVRPDLVGAFEASTHDWAADKKLVSGEDAEMIPVEEFVNASWLFDAQQVGGFWYNLRR